MIYFWIIIYILILICFICYKTKLHLKARIEIAMGYKSFISEHYIKKNIIKSYYSHTKLDKDKGYKLLDEIHDIFKMYNVDFWLSEGTALGVFRDNDLIEHDDDVDIGISGINYTKFLNLIIPELKKNKYYVDNIYDFYWIEKDNFIIDINILLPDNISVDKFERSDDIIPLLQTFYKKIWRNKIWNLPTEDYYECLYGNDWMIPQRKKP
jgi:hypothetical protein